MAFEHVTEENRAQRRASERCERYRDRAREARAPPLLLSAPLPAPVVAENELSPGSAIVPRRLVASRTPSACAVAAYLTQRALHGGNAETCICESPHGSAPNGLYAYG